jgi:hypothetical protein
MESEVPMGVNQERGRVEEEEKKRVFVQVQVLIEQVGDGNIAMNLNEYTCRS